MSEENGQHKINIKYEICKNFISPSIENPGISSTLRNDVLQQPLKDQLLDLGR